MVSEAAKKVPPLIVVRPLRPYTPPPPPRPAPFGAAAPFPDHLIVFGFGLEPWWLLGLVFCVGRGRGGWGCGGETGAASAPRGGGGGGCKALVVGPLKKELFCGFPRFLAIFGKKYGSFSARILWRFIFCQDTFSAFLRLKSADGH